MLAAPLHVGPHLWILYGFAIRNARTFELAKLKHRSAPLTKALDPFRKQMLDPVFQVQILRKAKMIPRIWKGNLITHQRKGVCFRCHIQPTLWSIGHSTHCSSILQQRNRGLCCCPQLQHSLQTLLISIWPCRTRVSRCHGFSTTRKLQWNATLDRIERQEVPKHDNLRVKIKVPPSTKWIASDAPATVCSLCNLALQLLVHPIWQVNIEKKQMENCNIHSTDIDMQLFKWHVTWNCKHNWFVSQNRLKTLFSLGRLATNHCRAPQNALGLNLGFFLHCRLGCVDYSSC